MKKLFFIVVVCLFSGMFYSCTPEDLEEQMPIEHVALSDEGEGNTPDGDGE